MLTEAELAAALRISARQVQRRAGGNPPDISASGAAWRSRDDGGYSLSAAVLHRLNRLAAYTDQFSKSPMVFDSRGLSGGLHSATTNGLSP